MTGGQDFEYPWATSYRIVSLVLFWTVKHPAHARDVLGRPGQSEATQMYSYGYEWQDEKENTPTMRH